jgi:hypothetical protein
MKTLLAFSFFSSALAIPTTVVTGGTCTIDSHHPDNNGYHIIGVNGYKTIMADEDSDDMTTYGDWGQKADDYLWSSSTTYPMAEMSECAKGLRMSGGGHHRSLFGDGRALGGHTGAPRPSPCRDETEEHNWRLVQTCSIMRFRFSESSGSTVFRMTNNDTFQACDFTDATELTDGGQLPSGAPFIDYVFEEGSLDNEFYFASQNGCEDGQKIAVKVVDLYETEYDPAYKAGTLSDRIQHCDCDHAIMSTSMSTEAAHAGFIEGCKSEMPVDLSCCPGDGEIGLGRSSRGATIYTGGGSCMRKSEQAEMIATARELYRFCSMTENKATCDKYKSGDCPYWRVYIHSQYAYNSMDDGLEGCSCTPDSDGNLPPHCVRNVEYGPVSGHSPKADCSYCSDAGCLGTYTDLGRDHHCWPGYLDTTA